MSESETELIEAIRNGLPPGVEFDEREETLLKLGGTAGPRRRTRRGRSTFSSNIAYSRSPAASRASAPVPRNATWPGLQVIPSASGTSSQKTSKSLSRSGCGPLAKTISRLMNSSPSNVVRTTA